MTPHAPRTPAPPRALAALAASLRALLVGAAAAAGVLAGVVGLLAPGPIRDHVVARVLDALDGALAGRLEVRRLDGPLGGTLRALAPRVVTPDGALALSARQISTRIRYLDLLSRRVSLLDAEVDDLTLPLWDDAGRVPVAAAFAPADPTPTETPSAWSVALEAAAIRGGQVSWAGDTGGAGAHGRLTDLTLTTSLRQGPAGLAWSGTLVSAELAGRRLTLSTAGGLEGGGLTLDPLDATWGPHSLQAHVRLPDLSAGTLDVRLDGLAVALDDVAALATGKAPVGGPLTPPGGQPDAHRDAHRDDRPDDRTDDWARGGGERVTVAGTIRGRWSSPPASPASPASLRADLTAKGGPVGSLHAWLRGSPGASTGAPPAGPGAAGPTLELIMEGRDLDLSRLPAALRGGPAQGARLAGLGATSVALRARGEGAPGQAGSSWTLSAQLSGLFGPGGALPPRVTAAVNLRGPSLHASVEAPGFLRARADGDLLADRATVHLAMGDVDVAPLRGLAGAMAGPGLDLAGVRGRLAGLDASAELAGFLQAGMGTGPRQAAFHAWLSLRDARVPLPTSATAPAGAVPGETARTTVAGLQGTVTGLWLGGAAAPGAHTPSGGTLELSADLEVAGAATPWGGARRAELRPALRARLPGSVQGRQAGRCAGAGGDLDVHGRLTAWGAWGGGALGPGPRALAARRLNLRDVSLSLCPGDWRVAGRARLDARGLDLRQQRGGGQRGGGRQGVGRLTASIRATRRRGQLLGLQGAVEADTVRVSDLSAAKLRLELQGSLSARGQLRADVAAQAQAPRAGSARWRRVELQARLSPKGAGRLGVEGAVHALDLAIGQPPTGEETRRDDQSPEGGSADGRAAGQVTARRTAARLSLVLGGGGLGVRGGGTWRVMDARSWGRLHPALEGEVSLDDDGALTLTAHGGVLRQLRASALLPTTKRAGFELRVDALRLEEARAGFAIQTDRLRVGGDGTVDVTGLRVEQLPRGGELTLDARLPPGRGRLSLDAQATTVRPGAWWARLRGLVGLPPTPRLPADGSLSGTARLRGTRAALAGEVALQLHGARVGEVKGLDGTLRATLTAPPRRGTRAPRHGGRAAAVGRLTLNAELRQAGGGAVKLEDLSVPLGVSLQPVQIRLGDAFESAGRVVLDDLELEPLGVRVGSVSAGEGPAGQVGQAGQARGRPLMGRVRGQLLMAPSPSRQLSLELEARGLGVGTYTGRSATVLATLEPDRTSFGVSLSWPGATRGVPRPRPPGGVEGPVTASTTAPTTALAPAPPPAPGEARGLLEVRAAVDAGVEPVLRGDMTWAQLAEAARRAALGGAVKLRGVGLEAVPWDLTPPASVAHARADGALTLQGTVEAPLLSGAMRVGGLEVPGASWAVDARARPVRRPSGGLVNRLGLRVTGALGAEPPRTLMEGSARLPHVLGAVFDGRPALEAFLNASALRVVARLNPVPNARWLPWALPGEAGHGALDALRSLVPGGALDGRLVLLGDEARGPTLTVAAHVERRRGPRGGGGPLGDEELTGLGRAADATARLGAQGLLASVTLDQLDGGALALTASAPVTPRAVLGEDGLGTDAVAALRSSTYAVGVRARHLSLSPLAEVLPGVFDEIQGALDGALEVQARRAGWSGQGRLVAHLDRVTVAPLGLARRDVQVAMRLEPGALTLEPLTLTEEGRGGGRLALEARAALGTPAGWDAGRMPLTGQLHMDGFPLLARKDLAARLDSVVDVGGTLARPRLLGRVNVARAQISPRLGGEDLQPIELPQDVRFVSDADEPGLQAAAPDKHVTAAALVGRLPVDLELDLTLPKRLVRITHPFLDVRPWGKLHAVARGGPLRLHGRVWLDDGAVTLYEQRFVLTDPSYIDFTGNPDTDPELHVAATYDISAVDLSAIGEETTEASKITVRLDGTAAAPGVPQLSSDPPMDESQIVSVVVLGSPVAGGGGGAASTERLSQVLLGALGLTSRLERELPFVDSLSLSAGTDALHLAVGKRVGPGLWFYYALNLGAPEGENVHEGRMEYRFGKRLRLGTRFGDARKGSLDLLYRWRY